MDTPIATVASFAPTPHAQPAAAAISIMLTAHLLGLVTGAAIIVGLIPIAIALLRMLV